MILHTLHLVLRTFLSNPITRNKSIMRNLPLIAVATLTAFTSTASAANIVFSFGAADPTATQTINRVAQTGANGNSANVTVANVLTTTGASSGMSTTATGTQWFSAGGGGTYSPLGNTAYAGGSALVDSWATAYVPANVGNIWQQGANGDNDGGSSMTFSGLTANTNYSFTLLSVRANGFLTDSGSYALSYNGGSAGVATSLIGSGTQTGNSIEGSGTGSSSGLNAREITWSFSTNDTPADAVLNLTGDWNVNAILVETTAVPEPSSTALLGLGGLALILRRRK